ncbi:MAG: 2-amino-4-hydroxy-6-hydroxymethyldihydropteridine diphosphokinase [Chloroflexi bacterium]|nr:2-amino-4-hydroxy-6-hydroxymethyldihydropteridine diphosphokinase [Chloroflexota bacterium]
MTHQRTASYIGLGSNLDSNAGDRSYNLRAALDAMRSVGRIGGISSVYETEAWGVEEEQPDYLNQVARLETALGPTELVVAMLRIESDFGRERSGRYSSRTIDLDVLLHGDAVIDEPGAQIPHPRLHERAFVLVPLAEIAPSVVHPVLGITVAEILAGVDRSGVRLIGR